MQKCHPELRKEEVTFLFSGFPFVVEEDFKKNAFLESFKC